MNLFDFYEIFKLNRTVLLSRSTDHRSRSKEGIFWIVQFFESSMYQPEGNGPEAKHANRGQGEF